jgi:hypothetical protein
VFDTNDGSENPVFRFSTILKYAAKSLGIEENPEPHPRWKFLDMA